MDRELKEWIEGQVKIADRRYARYTKLDSDFGDSQAWYYAGQRDALNTILRLWEDKDDK